MLVSATLQVPLAATGAGDVLPHTYVARQVRLLQRLRTIRSSIAQEAHSPQIFSWDVSLLRVDRLVSWKQDKADSGPASRTHGRCQMCYLFGGLKEAF